MQSLNLKKIFLYLLIASVAFSALMGIGVILFGNFGQTESRILLTTLIITVTSVLGLACGAFLETGRGKTLPVTVIALAILAAILWIIFIWATPGYENTFVRIAFSATLLAAACSHISLLSIARLDRRFIWSRYAAHFAVWILTAILLWIIWVDLKDNPEAFTRVIGVLSIVVAALTIITPVFHKLSHQTANGAEIDTEIARLQALISELEERRENLSNDEN